MKKRITKSDLIYNIEIFYKNKSRRIKVLLDTGNLLKDPITNIPVIIIEREKLREVLPDIILNDKNLINSHINELNEEIKTRCSIIPFKSIGKDNGIILGFRPDIIKLEEDDEWIEKKAIIGIYNATLSKHGKYSGLIGLNTLEF